MDTIVQQSGLSRSSNPNEKEKLKAFQANKFLLILEEIIV